MKVALITRHAIANYGSILQAFATQRAIEKLGEECIVIDYIRDDESYKKREITLLKSKPQWYNNALKRMLYLAIRQPESSLAGKKFEKIQNNILTLTKRYTNHEELRCDIPEADIYMTGSDQVWGPTENGEYDSSYCLDFVENKRKVAYASSFGRTEIPKEQIERFKKLLKGYYNISVRENSAVDFLNNIGIKSQQVLDPTFLLDAREWESLIKKQLKGKYILVYQLHNDKNLSRYAKRVSKKMGLPLVRISATLHQVVRGGKFVYLPDIGKFLSYIKNAECMITDSFHGTAFAINFNTNFIEVLPNNKTSTRNISILEMTGLTNRVLRNYDDFDIVKEKIDFSYANNVINHEREKSIDILRKMIEL